MSHTKEYVAVDLTVNENGEIQPHRIVYKKDRIFEIDTLKDIRRAAATKVWSSGIRYTVVIRGIETFLFEDGGRWFVEAKASA